MWKWIIGGTVLLLAFFIYRIVSGIRRALKVGNEQVATALKQLRPEDLPRLVQECGEFFRSAMGADLDPSHWQDAVIKLDEALKEPAKRQKLVRGLNREDVAYYWVLPLGAFLGHLLERHANGRWKFSTDSAPCMEITAGGGEMTTWPFDKVQKHFWQGDTGDLIAYVNTNVHLDRMVAQLNELEGPEEQP